jgi:hypothetical protein
MLPLKSLLSGLGVAAAVVAYFATPNSASASPITYDFVGASAYFSDLNAVFGISDNAPFNISGSFIYDASLASPLISASITVSGPADTPIPGLYNVPISASTSEILVAESAHPGISIIIYFYNSLLGVPDPLFAVGSGTIPSGSPYSNCGTGCFTLGDVEPTPLPPTAVLFAAGLGLLGFMGYWRIKQKGAANIAAA